MSIQQWYTDRSRCSAFEFCPRARYLNYHHGNIGIESPKKGLELWTGGMVHDCIDMIGNSHVAANVDELIDNFKTESLQSALDNSLLAIDDSNLAEINEQIDLQEVLIRLEQMWWEQFTKDYTLVASEQEINWPLTDSITFMSRPDKIVRRNSDGACFVINYKTVGNADETWRKQWRFDSQMISESVAAKNWLNEMVPISMSIGDTFIARWADLGWQSEPTTFGVLVIGLLKGKMSWGEEPRYLQNPLVNCWWIPGDGLNEAQFTHVYSWICSEAHDKCPGNKGHRLGNQWKRCRVSEHYPGGIKAWLDKLPKEFLMSFVLQLEAIIPSKFEVERWLQATTRQEEDIIEELFHINSPEFKLDESFPCHTHNGNCLRPRQCKFFNVCHGSAGADLNSEFVWRVPNHEQELVQIGEYIPNL